jgi:Flp pilus assembly protein TadD
MDEAMTHIRRAIELNPDNGAAHINLGHVLEVMADHREYAKAELLKGIELAASPTTASPPSCRCSQP